MTCNTQSAWDADPSAFSDKGYIFNFALPVQIQNNAPQMERMTHTFLLDPRPATDAFCTNYGTGSYEIRAVGIDSDGYPADAGLPDVTIQYRCGGRKCTLGTTSAIQGRYALQTRVPGACTNPTILANKEGYLTSETTFSADTWLNLTKKKTLSVRVVKTHTSNVDKHLTQKT